jgi:hypothetical protein
VRTIFSDSDKSEWGFCSTGGQRNGGWSRDTGVVSLEILAPSGFTGGKKLTEWFPRSRWEGVMRGDMSRIVLEIILPRLV